MFQFKTYFLCLPIKNLYQMKKSIFLVAFMLVTSFSFAQVKDRFRVNLDLGYAIPSSGGGGILSTIEPKWNLADNMSVGIRWQSALMAKSLIIDASGSVSNASLSGNTSFLATYDYYFNNGSSMLAPYLGAGLGIYSVASASVSSGSDVSSVSAGSKFGGVIRGGLEAGKFRVGVEYNLVPKSDSLNSNGLVLGNVSNSYLGISIGFFIGGGRWGGGGSSAK